MAASGDSRRREYARANLEHWNAWTEIHEGSAFYDVEGFLAGRQTLFPSSSRSLGPPRDERRAVGGSLLDPVHTQAYPLCWFPRSKGEFASPVEDSLSRPAPPPSEPAFSPDRPAPAQKAAPHPPGAAFALSRPPPTLTSHTEASSSSALCSTASTHPPACPCRPSPAYPCETRSTECGLIAASREAGCPARRLARVNGGVMRHIHPRMSGRALLCLVMALLVVAAVCGLAPPASAAPTEPTLDLAGLQALLDASPDGTVPGYLKTVVSRRNHHRHTRSPC